MDTSYSFSTFLQEREWFLPFLRTEIWENSTSQVIAKPGIGKDETGRHDLDVLHRHKGHTKAKSFPFEECVQYGKLL